METKKTNILVIGSATCDIFIECAPDEITPHILSGIKIDISRLHYLVGGGCINASNALKALGFEPLPIFKLGRDQTAQVVLKKIKALGLKTDYATFDTDKPTATSFIIPTPSENRTIFAYRGASEHLAPGDIPFEKLPQLSGIYLAPLTGASLELLPSAAEFAAKNQLPFMHNPSNYSLTNGWHLLKRYLPSIGTLLVNRAEAQLLWNKLHPNTAFSIEEFLQRVHEYTHQTIIMTDGNSGVYLKDKKDHIFQPRITVPVAQTVGAGDTFGATYFGCICRGFSTQKALHASTIQSSLHVRAHPLLSIEKINEKI
ncbi:MAG: carbohydrate kinase family protein [Candidatus Babeliaceae bacterium]|nr:carbohydrate kinase family protein [Candidatus Babeliaceae bacterium]